MEPLLQDRKITAQAMMMNKRQIVFIEDRLDILNSPFHILHFQSGGNPFQSSPLLSKSATLKRQYPARECGMWNGECVLITIDGESQQQIARIADESAIAGICVEDAIGYGRPAAVERAALCLSCVDCVDRLRGVDFPDDRAVFGRICAQTPVSRA